MDDNTSDHDLLVRIDERVDTIKNDLNEIKETLNEHGERLSKLERWRASVIGASAIIATLISIAIAILTH